MDAILNALLAYFVIVDPIGTALIFNGLTQGGRASWRRRMAWRAVLISVALVVGFGLFGGDLLGALGIQLDSFRVAGGLLIFYAAFGMITNPDRRERDARSEEEDISVFPLTIPLLAGPGSLTLTILLFSRTDGAFDVAALFVAIAVVYGLALVAFLASGWLETVVGRSGNDVLKRLLGVLLASLAIQFIADGVRGLIGTV